MWGVLVAEPSIIKSGRAGHAETNCKINVFVTPIGTHGVGKTCLVQYIYNDLRVKDHFGAMIWVYVSDFFDKKRITKDIIESIHGEEFNTSCSLNASQIELIERLKMCPKFLLLLVPKKLNNYQLSTTKYLPKLIISLFFHGLHECFRHNSWMCLWWRG